MYTQRNFKTKAELKRALAAGEQLGVYNPGLGGEPPRDGKVYLEGPHYPAAHTWYAEAWLKDDFIVRVK